MDNNKWWGNNKGYYFTDTALATASLLEKEDGADVSEELKTYTDARAKQLEYFQQSVQNEIQAMKNIAVD